MKIQIVLVSRDSDQHHNNFHNRSDPRSHVDNKGGKVSFTRIVAKIKKGNCPSLSCEGKLVPRRPIGPKFFGCTKYIPGVGGCCTKIHLDHYETIQEMISEEIPRKKQSEENAKKRKHEYAEGTGDIRKFFKRETRDK